MPPPDDLSLKPIAPLRTAEVPRAGHRELTEFRLERDATKASLTMWSMLAAITAAITASLLTEGALFYGFFLFLSILFGGVSGYKFWRLARAQSWQALPDGATETTALLEDTLTMSIRDWNQAVAEWNAMVAALNADIEQWRLKSLNANCREDGWSEASHAMERETLMTRGKTLMLERGGLIGRQGRIRRAIGHLGDAVRRSELESRLPDPEPHDG